MIKPPHEVTQQVSDEKAVYTLNPLEAPEQAAQGVIQPTWIRLPKSGSLCPYTGLSRSVMNGLILGAAAPVRSVSLKKRYAVRGTRLIHLDSLLAYLEAMSVSQSENQND